MAALRFNIVLSDVPRGRVARNERNRHRGPSESRPQRPLPLRQRQEIQALLRGQAGGRRINRRVGLSAIACGEAEASGAVPCSAETLERRTVGRRDSASRTSRASTRTARRRTTISASHIFAADGAQRRRRVCSAPWNCGRALRGPCAISPTRLSWGMGVRGPGRLPRKLSRTAGDPFERRYPSKR